MRRCLIVAFVVMLALACVLAGCIPSAVTPPAGEEASPPITHALPKSGEWIALTGSDQFAFTFTVNSDGTGIPNYSIRFTEFKCGGVQVSGGWGATVEPIVPITAGQFTINTKEYIQHGPDWDIAIQGKFDENGTHASGTWEISAEETVCAGDSWEASAP